MPEALRHTRLSARDLLATAGPFLLIALLLLAIAYWALDPTPPRRVVLATGPDQGAYAEFGERYASLLAREGIQVELRRTQGSAENLALLKDPRSPVDLAFVQSGVDDAAAAPPDDVPLVSLGSLFFEPVWLFYRQAAATGRLGGEPLASLKQLPGWTVEVGSAGSGVPRLMEKLLDANGLKPAQLGWREQPQTPAVMSLLAGTSDALVFASAPESQMVQMLLQTPGIGLFDFVQAEAYARRMPFLSAVRLPRGIVDLARDRPPADVRLLAPTATLVARQDLHPALVQLFVQAAQEIHGDAGWFQRKGDFPSPVAADRPLASEAERFYRSGPPVLQRYLPFWIANLLERMAVVLVSLVAVLIPLSRVLPPLYDFRVRSRVFRWYGQLRAVENAHGQRPAEELARELDAIEAGLEQVAVPLSHTDELYALRGHIAMVRRQLQLPPAPSAQTPPGG